MRLINRYVLRQTLGVFVLVLMSLTSAVWIGLALKELNLVTSKGQDTWLLVRMTLLALPNLLGLIAPFALLIAVLQILNRMSTDSELIVLSSAGQSVWLVGRPLLALAAVVTLGVGFVNHVAMPWSLRQLRAEITEVRTDLIAQVLQPGRFSSPEAGLTFHIKDRGFDGSLVGLLLHDTRNPKQQTTFLAERGQLLTHNNSAYLIMDKGHVLQQNEGEPPSIVTFDRYPIDLTAVEQRTNTKIAYKPRERFTAELAAATPANTPNAREFRQLKAELHDRSGSALYPIVFALIAIAFAGQSQSTREGRLSAYGIAFLICVGVRVAGLTATNLAAGNPKLTFAIYGVPTLALLLSAVAAYRWMRPRRQGAIAALLGRILERRRVIDGGGSIGSHTLARRGGGR